VVLSIDALFTLTRPVCGSANKARSTYLIGG
jgi:hypothetical protein